MEMKLIIGTDVGIEEQDCSLSLRCTKLLGDPCLFGQQFNQHLVITLCARNFIRAFSPVPSQSLLLTVQHIKSKPWKRKKVHQLQVLHNLHFVLAISVACEKDAESASRSFRTNLVTKQTQVKYMVLANLTRISIAQIFPKQTLLSSTRHKLRKRDRTDQGGADQRMLVKQQAAH